MAERPEVPASGGASSELQLEFPKWGEKYIQALLEADRSNVCQKIHDAHAVMEERLRQIDYFNEVTLASIDYMNYEVSEINDALQNLELLLGELQDEPTDI